MQRRRRLAAIAAHVVAQQQRREQRVHGDDCLPAAGPTAREHHNGLGVELPGGRPEGPARTPTEAAVHNLSLADHEKTPLMHAPFDWAVDGAPRREGLRVVSPEMAAQFDRDGFCVYEDAFAPDELAALVEEIDRLEAELSNDGGISSKEEITFCAHLVLKSEMCRAFTGQRLFSDLCHDLLAADTARLYWDQSVYKKPAPEKIFPFHQVRTQAFCAEPISLADTRALRAG